MKRTTPLLALSAILLIALHPAPAPAGGNIEAINSSGQQIINAFWDTRTFPIRYKINRNDALFPLATLKGQVDLAFAAWEDLPDNTLDFAWGGTSSVTSAAADGDNVLVFNPPVDPGNFVAAAPCTTLTTEQTVTDSSDGNPSNGLGYLRLGATPVLLVPVGVYSRGTNIDCDILFDVIGNVFTTDGTVGTQDVRMVATHEIGHWLSLSHTFMPDASLYPSVDTNFPGDGMGGPATLHPDDISSAGHIYKDVNFDSNYGTITGIVTLKGERGDGVHVTALDADTLTAVAGRFSISRFFDPADAIDSADFLANGSGFYRLDGLPPGDYYVYAEWLDSTDEPFGRLDARHNLTTGNSNVADGDPGAYAGELGFRPERFEFYNTSESADGGDGSTAGLAADNPDEATRITVTAGAVIPGVDIAINLDPDIGKTNLERQDPTGIGRHDLAPFADLIGGVGMSQDGTDDDYWILHFAAADLPAPPYNVLEGIWTKNGRSDASYTGGLLLSSAADPNLVEPFIVFDAPRLVAGGPGGNTGTTEITDVRDRFNVTINDGRDLYFVIKQPESVGTAIAEGYYIVASAPPLTCSISGVGCTLSPDSCTGSASNVCTGGTGNTFFTDDGFGTFLGFPGDQVDILYRVRTETAPPVMITGATPASLAQAATGTVVTISGAGFKAGAQVEFFRPTFNAPDAADITITSTTFVNSSTLEVTVDVAANAIPDIRDVLVRNPEAVIPNRSRVFDVTAGTDTDLDGWADAGDCAAGDGTLWSIPGGVDNTVVASIPAATSVRFDWAPPALPGGASPLYNVVRGDAATLSSSGGSDYGTCRFAGLTTPDATDADLPAAGQIFIYMLTPANNCGAGPYTTPAGNPLRDSNAGNC